MTPCNGNAVGNNGGAILNAGALTLDNVTITGSRARYGGAIYSTGMLIITGSILSNV